MSLDHPFLDVEVPASLSNLGPGLDTLGMAVDLFNRFTFYQREQGSFSVDGNPIPPEEHLAIHTAVRAADHFKIPIPIGLGIQTVERVPRARGLGSSSTARVAGLLAFLSCTGSSVSEEEALLFLSAEEGHPDNALPAYLGGMITCLPSQGGMEHRKLLPGMELEIALCMPERLVPTDEARLVLPSHPPLPDAVFNLQRLSFLISGFLTGDFEAIRNGVGDRLHQDVRADLIGPVGPALAGARSLGAAAFVSGSGSTLAALVESGGPTALVADRLARPFRDRGIDCKTTTTRPVSTGWRNVSRTNN